MPKCYWRYSTKPFRIRPKNRPSIIEKRRISTFMRLIALVMSIGNQKFDIPRKYQYQIGIWYFCPKFLGIFLVFYRYFEEALVKIWLNIGIFGRIKIGLVFGFCSCQFIRIGLVSVIIFLKMAPLNSTPFPSEWSKHPAVTEQNNSYSHQITKYRGLQLLWYILRSDCFILYSARSMANWEMKLGALDPHHR